MSRRARLGAVLVPLCLALVGLSACGDDSDGTDAAGRACEQMELLAVEVDDLRTTIQGEPTIGELRQARDELREAQAEVDEAFEDVGEQRADAFAAAWEELDGAVSDLDDDATVPDALASVEEEVRAVVAARDDLVSAVECPA